MRIVEIDRLCSENFNPIFINGLRQFWHTTRSFQCIGNPKGQNLFLYIDGCKITYTDKSGKVFTAESGDVVYTPQGSEYRANLSDFKSSSSHTVGINFLLFDESGEGVVLSDEILIFPADKIAGIAPLFDRAAATDFTISSRITLLEIISALSKRSSEREGGVVSVAVRYLSMHIEENVSISHLADVACVSEVYLRRKFKEEMGISPAEYRNALRLDRALSYLKFGDVSVQEISDMLGYGTVSHFICEFKKRYGSSPLKYRKKQNYVHSE